MASTDLRSRSGGGRDRVVLDWGGWGGGAITSSGIIGGEEGVVGEDRWSLAEDGFYSFQPQSAYAFAEHEGVVPEEEKDETGEEGDGQNLDALGMSTAGMNLASVGVLLVTALGAAVNI